MPRNSPHPDGIPESREEKAARKQRAIDAINAKERSQVDVAKEFGITRQAVSLWVITANQHTKLGTKPKKRGRKKIRNLTVEEEARLITLMRNKRPKSAGIVVEGEENVWNEFTARALIKRETGVTYKPKKVYRMLEDWIIDPVPLPPKWRNMPDIKGEEMPPASERPKRKRGRPPKIKSPDGGYEPDQTPVEREMAKYKAAIEDARKMMAPDAEIPWENDPALTQKAGHGQRSGKHKGSKPAPKPRRKKRTKNRRK